MTNRPSEVEAFLNKAQESIDASDVLLKEGLPNIAVSRAYYAMFYIAEALLLSKGLTFSKHSGVIAAVGEHFAKTKLLDPKFHRYLIDAYEYREISDYDPLESISEETTARLINYAKEFLEVTKGFLKIV